MKPSPPAHRRRRRQQGQARRVEAAAATGRERRLGGVDGPQRVHGRNLVGGDAGAHQPRRRDGGDDADDRDHHQQFDQGEAAAATSLHSCLSFVRGSTGRSRRSRRGRSNRRRQPHGLGNPPGPGNGCARHPGGIRPPGTGPTLLQAPLQASIRPRPRGEAEGRAAAAGATPARGPAGRPSGRPSHDPPKKLATDSFYAAGFESAPGRAPGSRRHPFPVAPTTPENHPRSYFFA